jgi:hypothetical protein
MGPIPLNCDSHLLDQVIDELTSFGSRHKERVIFLGKQPLSKARGSAVVLKCTWKCHAPTPSNTKDALIQATLIWQPTSANFTPTSNLKTHASSEE